jgi:hypothetical protein
MPLAAWVHFRPSHRLHASVLDGTPRHRRHCRGPYATVHFPRRSASCTQAARRRPWGRLGLAARVCSQRFGIHPRTGPWCLRAPRTPKSAATRYGHHESVELRSATFFCSFSAVCAEIGCRQHTLRRPGQQVRHEQLDPHTFLGPNARMSYEIGISRKWDCGEWLALSLWSL